MHLTMQVRRERRDALISISGEEANVSLSLCIPCVYEVQIESFFTICINIRSSRSHFVLTLTMNGYHEKHKV